MIDYDDPEFDQEAYETYMDMEFERIKDERSIAKLEKEIGGN